MTPPHMPADLDSLTCGERVIRCLRGDPVDRIPFGVGIGWSPWGQTLERWRTETGVADLDPAHQLGFDNSFALAPGNLGMFPAFEPQVIDEDDDFVVHRDARGILMRDRRDGGSMPEFLRHPVTCRADWEKLKAERLRPDDAARADADWNAFRHHVAVTGEAVQVGCFPYGVFGTTRDLMGVERLLLAFYDEPDLVADIMTHLTTVWLAVWERTVVETRIDHIHIWEDMSGRQGPLISPAMVRRFMMPCYDRIADFARRHSVPLISVDSDGLCDALLPVMTAHGVNVFFPFEVQAGSNIERTRAAFASLGILGGLDKRVLADGRTAINREVERAAGMVPQGRYIPGFDHLIPPDVPWDNFEYAASRIREVCWG